MLSMKHRRCARSSCTRQPVFGFPGGKVSRDPRLLARRAARSKNYAVRDDGFCLHDTFALVYSGRPS